MAFYLWVRILLLSASSLALVAAHSNAAATQSLYNFTSAGENGMQNSERHFKNISFLQTQGPTAKATALDRFVDDCMSFCILCSKDDDFQQSVAVYIHRRLSKKGLYMRKAIPETLFVGSVLAAPTLLEEALEEFADLAVGTTKSQAFSLFAGITGGNAKVIKANWGEKYRDLPNAVKLATASGQNQDLDSKAQELLNRLDNNNRRYRGKTYKGCNELAVDRYDYRERNLAAAAKNLFKATTKSSETSQILPGDYLQSKVTKVRDALTFNTIMTEPNGDLVDPDDSRQLLVRNMKAIMRNGDDFVTFLAAMEKKLCGEDYKYTTFPGGNAYAIWRSDAGPSECFINAPMWYGKRSAR